MAGILLWAQSDSTSVSETAAAARQFLSGLTEEQKSDATFGFADEERFDFHFFPRTREGLPFKEMTPAQRKLAHAFLAAALSPEGNRKVNQIMHLEQVLWEMENRNPVRDPDLYYFSIFGDPSMRGTWGWRFEGHHLTLNFTFKDGRLISWTPSFFGANPAEVRQGPHKGLRVLAAEEEGGRRLLRSLNADQKEKAIIADVAPADILTGVQLPARLDEFRGIPFSDLTLEQAGQLVNLIRIYARRLRSDQVESEMDKIRRAGFDEIWFAWAGSEAESEPHYYRIHSPEFVIEYDNTQNNANHIHTVWRDFKNDFGRDELAEHYARSHSSSGVEGIRDRDALHSHSVPSHPRAEH
jgi:hypothetical protein